MANLTAEQRLHKATTDLIGRDEFVALAGVLMIGGRKIDDNIPTACTNGRDELYGREFVEALSDAELRFLILHENYHKMYRHLTTWKHLSDIDHDRANRACDYVINLKLQQTNACSSGWIRMPDCGLVDIKYAGMDAQQVFNMLQGDGGGKGKSGSGGMDEHDWDGAQELSDADREALERDIDEALRQGAVLSGKLGSGGNRDITELLEPQKDWRELLRDFISTVSAGKDYSTWRKPNRKYIGMDIIMPSSISESMGELVIAIDTSGSIDSDFLNSFMGEVTGITRTAKPSKIHVLYWDTQVCKTEVYLESEIDTIAQSTKPAGGGGTDVDCVPMYLNEHGIKPECVVVLTDGYLGGSWGNAWPSSVLWCVKNNRSATANVGVTIHIN